MSLMLLTALVCVSVSHVVSHVRVSRQVQELQGENRELRDELGYIDVKNPAKAYIKPLHPVKELEWKVRVYLPAGRKYTRHFWVEKPTKVSVTEFTDEGQFTMTAVFERNAAEGSWFFRLVTPRSGLVFRVSEESVKTGTMSFSVYGHGEQIEVDPDKPIVLLRGRKPVGPEVKFKVWLEPIKESGPGP